VNPNRPAAVESEGVATLLEGIVADYGRIGK
jgi:hypothetical protein